MSKRRVVITGIGMVSPLGLTLAESWNNAKQGKSGVTAITRFDASSYPTRIAAEIKGFAPERYLEIKEVKKHDPFSQYGIAASQEAWTDSKLETATYDRRRMGCLLGIGIGGITTLEKYTQILVDNGVRKISPFLIPAMISNLGPGNIAIRYGLKGVNFTITSACASANHSIGESFQMIANDRLDVALTGGSEAAITPVGIGGFCAMKALSTRNEEPEKASRPFDLNRDGFIMGEGSIILVLEEFEGAKRRGAKIYAEVLGYGCSCDAFHITAPCTDGAGAIDSMQAALKDAGVSPTQVQYVNAHGTSTQANDSAETQAIKSVFGDYAKDGLMVSSTKSMTGHLLGAAGAIEAAFTAMTLLEGVVPPTINYETVDPECDLDYVPNVARKAAVKYALSNSFGFGGTNASLLLAKV